MSEASSGGLTRRAFLKTTAAATAVTAAGAGLSTVAAHAASPTRGLPDEQSFVNTCRGNCGGKCVLVGKVREGKLVQTRPYEPPEGFERSRMGCVKGVTYPQRLYAPNRVLYPMIQRGERGSDNWERVSWDEAIAYVSDHINKAQAEYGPNAFGLWHSYGSEGWLNGAYHQSTGVGYHRFLNTFGGTVIIPGGDQAQVYMGLFVMQHGTNSTADYTNAKTLIAWGANVTDTVRCCWPYICDARDKGARMIAVDPRYTITAAGSDTWIPVRSGTDGALMLAMANFIIDNDLVDWDFLAKKSVAPLLIKDDGSYFKLSDMGIPPTEGPISPWTGQPVIINPEVVFDKATGQLASQFTAEDPAVTGEFEYEGTRLRTVFDYVRDMTKQFTVEFAAKECDISEEQVIDLATTYATNGPTTVVMAQGICHHVNSRHNYKNLAYLASLTGNIDKPGACIYLNKNHVNVETTTLTTKEMYPDPSLMKPYATLCSERVPEVLETGKLGEAALPLKVVMIVSANPFASESGRPRFLETLKHLDCLVTVDCFMSDTARYSDVILPVGLSFEQEDFLQISSHEVDFLMQKAVEPAGEVKSDFEIYNLLAPKIGLDGLYDKDAEGYLHALLDNEANKKIGRTYDDFKREGVIADWSEEPVIGTEANALKRVQFYLPDLIARDVAYAVLPAEEKIPWYEHAMEAYQDNPLREKYPLFGNSEHSNYTGHSMYNDIPWIHEIWGDPYVMLNDETAAERGIAEDDLVRVFNDRGEVVLRARLTKGLRKDSIILPHGPQQDAYRVGHPQDLTLCFSDLTGNSSYNDFLCEVEKWKGGE